MQYTPQFSLEVTAGINFTDNGELMQSMLKRVYTEGNQMNPVNISTT